jgi:hypothetical protein
MKTPPPTPSPQARRGLRKIDNNSEEIVEIFNFDNIWCKS